MSELRKVIDSVLCYVHIETGRKDDYEEVLSNLENAIAGNILAKQQEEIAELKAAVESALNIKDLWVYNGDIPKWHEGEAQALSKMHDKFVDVLAKNNKGE